MELWTYYASVFPPSRRCASPATKTSSAYTSTRKVGWRSSRSGWTRCRVAGAGKTVKHETRDERTHENYLSLVAICRDPKWSGGNGPRASLERDLPSFKWTRPSYWKPLVTKVDNMLRMDFENPSLDGKFNTADRSNVHLIDRVLVRKPSAASPRAAHVVAMVKRKKHDKDKYYNLARQQGYRARSAFKLIQLNKKYDFLSTAKVCIDLCAAPGGWCQVAAKYMPASSIILGIDLLPIRPIRGVKTFQCDITTTRCRQIIKQEMQSWQADVVLCDGAPNVGAEYSKDAYVQNELALVALKLAVDVMGRGGTFVSKVFRSQDYNALLWVFKQLFKKVSATKPLSSRNESAEIFVVCEQFLAPQSIDPKLFDPKYVFDQVDAQEKTITIFHPKFGDRKRHREGMFHLFLLLHVCMSAAFSRVSSGLYPLATSATCSQKRYQAFPVPAHAADSSSGGKVALCLQFGAMIYDISEMHGCILDGLTRNGFLTIAVCFSGYDEALGMTLTNECSVSQFIDAHDPIRLLTDTTKIKFFPEDDVYRDHKHTTDEVVTCLSDLKVLGKSDFKSLLKWRTRMQKYKEELLKVEQPEEDEKPKKEEKKPERELTEKEKDALVREELSQLRANVQAKKKREKKKQKLRIRAALGMDAEGIDVTEAESAFSLKDLKLSKDKVDDLDNVGAEASDDEELQFETSDEEEEDAGLEDSDAEYDELLESSMDKAYEQFLTRRGDDVKTRKAVKRTKVAKRALAGEALVQDSEMFDGDMKQYQQMINPDEVCGCLCSF
ncbi:unnamed protein product [Phytophthora fragariaefolia]|uniref:Unnamed protein product n=1 Tax=Phytophthora fragariaefolia TaxID=1490495 RepID=A0A9W6WX61_9STRA|nr:unnamed protein product [Phytophthora fragariaefolia]